MRKLSLETVQFQLSELGFTLLGEYVGCSDQMLVRCPKGHETTRRLLNIRRHGCAVCYKSSLTQQTPEEARAKRRDRRKTEHGSRGDRAYRRSVRGKMAAAKSRKTESYKASQRKYKQKPNVRVAIALRKRFGMAVRGGFKAGSAVRDLGCTIAEFKLYIEALWEPGMTWTNWGKGPGTWQIDHRKPLFLFDLSKSDQVKEACLFINLQPLWHEDHARKSAEDLANASP